MRIICCCVLSIDFFFLNGSCSQYEIKNLHNEMWTTHSLFVYTQPIAESLTIGSCVLMGVFSSFWGYIFWTIWQYIFLQRAKFQKHVSLKNHSMYNNSFWFLLYFTETEKWQPLYIIIDLSVYSITFRNGLIVLPPTILDCEWTSCTPILNLTSCLRLVHEMSWQFVAVSQRCIQCCFYDNHIF